MYDGLVAGAYDLRHFNYEYAMSFNNALSNEPELQNLHREMVERFHGLVEQEELSSLSEVTSKAISEAVVEYSSRFWGYVQANRYYALSLNTDSQHKWISLNLVILKRLLTTEMVVIIVATRPKAFSSFGHQLVFMQLTRKELQ
jgi:hypothetical protein